MSDAHEHPHGSTATESDDKSQEENATSTSTSEEEDPKKKGKPRAEAVAWSKRYFNGEEKYADLYSVCEKLEITNDPVAIALMRKKRTWKIRVRNAWLSNFGDLNDYFLRFCVGYNLVHHRTPVRAEAVKSTDEKNNTVIKRPTIAVTGTAGVTFFSSVIKELPPDARREFRGFNVEVRHYL